MKVLKRNPVVIWLYRAIQSTAMEFRSRNLKIGYLSKCVSCSFGNYNTIYKNVSLNTVLLGDFTYVSDGTKISKAKIGKFCSIGPDCKIGLGKHPSSKFVSTHPVFFSMLKQAQVSFSNKNRFEEFEEINIGNDVWVGANAIILDGVTVSDGVIIGAGSVVTKDIPPYAIVGGIPAKIIKYRFERNEIDKLLKIKWWDMDLDYLRKNYKKLHDIKKFLVS